MGVYAEAFTIPVGIGRGVVKRTSHKYKQVWLINARESTKGV